MSLLALGSHVCLFVDLHQPVHAAFGAT